MSTTRVIIFNELGMSRKNSTGDLYINFIIVFLITVDFNFNLLNLFGANVYKLPFVLVIHFRNLIYLFVFS